MSEFLKLRVDEKLYEYLKRVAESSGTSLNRIANQLLLSAINHEVAEAKKNDIILQKILKSDPSRLEKKLDDLEKKIAERDRVTDAVLLSIYALVRGLALSKVTPDRVIHHVEESIEKRLLDDKTIYEIFRIERR